jgi:hypothetical protein
MCGLTILFVLAGPARADDGEPWDGWTVAEQTGAGVGGGLVGGASLYLVGYVYGASKFKAKDDPIPQALAGMGGILGAQLGIALGVKAAGDHRGGTGTWIGTLKGSTVGIALAGTVVLSLPDKVPNSVLIGILTAVLVAPPIIGYHLSAGDPSTESRVMVPVMLHAF